MDYARAGRQEGGGSGVSIQRLHNNRIIRYSQHLLHIIFITDPQFNQFHSTMLRITLLLILSISVLGFAPNAHLSITKSGSSVAVPLRMAEEPQEVAKDQPEEPDADDSMVSSKFEAANQNPTNLVRDVGTEQKWRDTEIGANTQFDLANFSSIFVLVPGKCTHLYDTN